MKKTEKSQITSSLIWACISVTVGIIGFAILKQPLFLIFGSLGAGLLIVFGK